MLLSRLNCKKKDATVKLHVGKNKGMFDLTNLQWANLSKDKDAKLWV